MSKKEEKERRVWTEWFDRPGSRRVLWRVLWGICLFSVLAEWAVERDGHFGIDGWFAFYAALGFAACAAMIFVSKGLGHVLKRGENYYGEAEAGAAPPPNVKAKGGRENG